MYIIVAINTETRQFFCAIENDKIHAYVKLSSWINYDPHTMPLLREPIIAFIFNVTERAIEHWEIRK